MFRIELKYLLTLSKHLNKIELNLFLAFYHANNHRFSIKKKKNTKKFSFNPFQMNLLLLSILCVYVHT